MQSNPALERAILANPEDGDAYMVYADWLQGQGDPRGELIALQAAGALAFLDQHANVLADFEANADAFRHRVLDVSDTYLSSDAVERLRQIPKQLVADQLREDDDPEYRFVCVGE